MHINRHVFVLAVAAFLVATAVQAREWSFRYYKETVSLDFYPLEIALYDLTPSAQLAGRSPHPIRLPNGDVAVGEELGSGWFRVDLSDVPSGTDPEAYALSVLNEYATDPNDDVFAAPMFGTLTFRMIVTPKIAVGFEAATPQGTVDTVLQTAGVATVLEEDWIRPSLFLTTGERRSGVDLLDAINLVAMDPDVRFAAPNWIYMGVDLVDVRVETPPVVPVASLGSASLAEGPPRPLAGTCLPLEESPPADPFFFAQWGMEQSSGIDVDALDAWKICTGDGVARVLILDDGVQLDHPDLSVLPGADFTDECSVGGTPFCDGRPRDLRCDRHGTAIAGRVAALGNGLGVVGIAPNLKVVPLRIGKYSLRTDGSCRAISESAWVARGLMAATSFGGPVANLSWNYGFRPDPIMKEAFEVAYEEGLLTFNSAGNNGFSVVAYPGPYPEVQSISGIGPDGERMVLSPNWASNFGVDVAFSAPASPIVSTDLTGTDGYSSSPGGFGLDHAGDLNGTSHASPIAAGIAASIFVLHPAWTSEEVLDLMKRTAKDFGAPGRDDVHGDGFVNAKGAFSEIFVDGFESGDSSKWN